MFFANTLPFHLVFCILTFLPIPGKTSDPCNENVYLTSLTHLPVRTPSNILGPRESGICDRYIARQWYRLDSYALSTSSPEAFACGTEFPIWMNDTLPREGSTSNVMMCIRRYSSPCYNPYSMQIKNCNGFIVYHLIPPSICNAAYCFQRNLNCVNKTVPSVNVEFNGFLWTKEEINENQTEHDSAIRFLCNFTLLQDQNLYYRITWYLDDIEVDLNQVVTRSTKLNATITAYEILGYGKKLGTMIQCRVGALLQNDEKGCNTRTSDRFFAGIKVLSPKVTVSTKTGSTIKLQSNIPFADSFTVLNGRFYDRYLSIYLSNPSDTDVSCHGLSTNYYKCEQQIPSLKFPDRFQNDGRHKDWNKIIEFTVAIKKSTQYGIPPSEVTLRLKTGNIHGNGSKFFDNVFLQDVVVQGIDDNSDPLSSCTSVTDPHLKSFDQVYFENQIGGTFVLYRNEDKNQEVQVIQEKCHQTHDPFCNCAVAVRSGRDIFVMDVCDGIDYKYIDFILCDDKVLDPVQVNEKKYDIRMPSGTTVTVIIREWPSGTQKWQLDITITPTLSDKYNTSGLCGIFDGEKSNDFTRSTGQEDPVDESQSYLANYPYNFTKSWSFTYNLPGKSLFTQDPDLIKNLKSINETTIRLCNCNSNHPNEKGTIDCSYDHSVRCTNLNGAKLPCRIASVSVNLRRKRNAEFADVYLKHEIVKRNTFIVSREDAEGICFPAFSRSTMYQTCQNKVVEFTNSSLSNCVMDVMLTGDVNITRLHLDAANQECSIIASQNVTFQSNEPDVVTELEMLCLNNCSERGICNKGNCTCDEGFAGTDCSFDKYAPPKLFPNIDEKLCDLSEGDCLYGSVHGEYFFRNSETLCYLNRITILPNSSRIEDFLKVDLVVQTLFSGDCPLLLRYSVNTFASVFTFMITNDESRFTEARTKYTYQSRCQEPHNKSGNIVFTLKDDFCFINGICVAKGETSQTDKCKTCNSKLRQHQWSPVKSCHNTKDEVSPQESTSDEEIMFVIIAIAGSVLVIAGAVLVLAVLVNKKNISQGGSQNQSETAIPYETIMEDRNRIVENQYEGLHKEETEIWDKNDIGQNQSATVTPYVTLLEERNRTVENQYEGLQREEAKDDISQNQSATDTHYATILEESNRIVENQYEGP